MSASLVGSEMCIRDSYLCLSRWVPARSRPDRGPGRGAENFGYACASVSYTHLTLPTICSV
eukprot:11813934-Alexandrium_andersonii.AAC.1